MDEIQQIREIRVLKQLNGHPNIIFLREIIFDKRTGTLCLIFELMTMNLYEFIRGRQRLLPSETVCKFMYQLVKALEYLHRHTFFHRDVKPENILIKDDILKLADFGSCRQTLSKHPYRAPECLLTDGYYRNQMDIWSAGCVMFEIITLRPLFPGTNELDQISKIHDVLGTPPASTLDKFQHRNSAVDFNFPPRRGTGIARHLAHCSSDTIDLINQLCVYDPDHRISATQALHHTYFDVIRNQENEQMQEQGGSLWNAALRVTKTSEDRYIRSDSSSSGSSVDEPSTSPRSNMYNSSVGHPQTLKPDFKRILYPPPKAQSLVDTRIQGQSIKKPMQHKYNTKTKSTISNYHYSQPHQSQPYYSSFSTVGADGLPNRSPTNMQSNKSGPMSFLPRISGASAFSNYSTTTANSTLITNKVKRIK
ncbi:unnamed protein product [Rotaria sp. Silwood2]|nr:unnamed protein product [Rotaria sp. Silwood2]